MAEAKAEAARIVGQARQQAAAERRLPLARDGGVGAFASAPAQYGGTTPHASAVLPMRATDRARGEALHDAAAEARRIGAAAIADARAHAARIEAAAEAASSRVRQAAEASAEATRVRADTEAARVQGYLAHGNGINY